MTDLEFAASTDGTKIGYDSVGAGPAIVLVGGAFNDRTTVAPLAQVLSGFATAYTYDRRGRGSSGDTPPYAVDREIEDLAAVIGATGGPAAVFGHSSGAVLALLAARADLPITRLAVYEPPYRPAAGSRILPADLAARAQAAVDAGDREAAVRIFLTEGVGVPAAAVDGMAGGPQWAWMLAIAHTLPYDLRITQGHGVPPTLAGIRVRTLVMDGGNSPADMRQAAAEVAATVPTARYLTVPDQDHGVLQQPAVLGPVLQEFLAG
jgi:pimeloyl-ACP methyl ester carboxylesterase